MMFKRLVAFRMLCLVLFTRVSSTEETNVGFMKLRVSDYENYLDRKATGSRCETMSWLGDNCDPMFHICVTSQDNARCNILNKRRGHFADAKMVAEILKEDNIALKIFPKSVRVDVRVSDYDSSGNHDHIADFTQNFTSTTGGSQLKSLAVGRYKVRITLEASFRCASNYYGDKCGTYCLEDGRTYKCNQTGGKICLLPCANGGQCFFNHSRNGFECRCTEGFAGDSCNAPSYCTPTNNPCLNGAACYVQILPSQRYAYRCFCPSGYHGNHCENAVATKQHRSSTTSPQLSTMSTPSKVIISQSTVSPMTPSRVIRSQSTVSPMTPSRVIRSQSTVSKLSLTAFYMGNKQGETPTAANIWNDKKFYLFIGLGLVALVVVSWALFAALYMRRRSHRKSKAENIEVHDNVVYSSGPTPTVFIKPHDQDAYEVLSFPYEMCRPDSPYEEIAQ